MADEIDLKNDLARAVDLVRRYAYACFRRCTADPENAAAQVVAEWWAEIDKSKPIFARLERRDSAEREHLLRVVDRVRHRRGIRGRKTLPLEHAESVTDHRTSIGERDLRVELILLFDRLDAVQRRIVELRISGAGWAEIAKQVDLPLTTVYRIFENAVAGLRYF